MSDTSTEPPVCFVDTNIWLYAFVSGQDNNKLDRARQLIQERESTIAVSSQVINEVCVNLLKKAHVPESMLQQLVRSFYQKYPVVIVDQDIQVNASQLRERFSLSFWDSLIVAAAVHCGASMLYSEDMQSGLTIDDRLTIVNPLVQESNSSR